MFYVKNSCQKQLKIHNNSHIKVRMAILRSSNKPKSIKVFKVNSRDEDAPRDKKMSKLVARHAKFITSGKYVASIWSLPIELIDTIMAYLDTPSLVAAYKNPWVVKERNYVLYPQLSCRRFQRLLNNAYIRDLTAALLYRGINPNILFSGCRKNSLLISGGIAASPFLGDEKSRDSDVDLFSTWGNYELIRANLKYMGFVSVDDIGMNNTYENVFTGVEFGFYVEKFWHKDNHNQKVDLVMSKSPYECIKHFDFNISQLSWNGRKQYGVRCVDYRRGPRGIHCIAGHSFMNHNVCNRRTVLSNDVRIARKKKYQQRGVIFHYHNESNENMVAKFKYLDDPMVILNV